MFSACASLCLLSSIAGCASDPVINTVYQQVYIPDSLLVGCPGVEWQGGSFETLAELAARRKSALRGCDDRFTAARQYQDDIRAKAKAAAEKPGAAP